MKVIDLLEKAHPDKLSRSALKRLVKQGGVTFIDHPGWGGFPGEKDQYRLVDGDAEKTVAELYGEPKDTPGTPEYIKFGKFILVEIDNGIRLTRFTLCDKCEAQVPNPDNIDYPDDVEFLCDTCKNIRKE